LQTLQQFIIFAPKRGGCKDGLGIDFNS